MRAANLAVKFLLELTAFAGLAVWGWHVGDSWTRFVFALAAPTAAIVVWGRFAAPKSTHRLRTRWRVPLELGVFALAAAAIAVAGYPVWALVFAVVAVVNAMGLFAFDQLEA